MIHGDLFLNTVYVELMENPVLFLLEKSPVHIANAV